jgi:hypothetical protein
MDWLGRIASDVSTAKFSGDMQDPRELQRRGEPLDPGRATGYSRFVSACCRRERGMADRARSAWPSGREDQRTERNRDQYRRGRVRCSGFPYNVAVIVFHGSTEAMAMEGRIYSRSARDVDPSAAVINSAGIRRSVAARSSGGGCR